MTLANYKERRQELFLTLSSKPLVMHVDNQLVCLPPTGMDFEPAMII